MDTYVFGDDPEDQQALLFKPCGPASVVLDAVRERMGRAINLDGQLGFGAVEVEHIGTDGMLSAEFEIVEPASTQTDP